MCSYSTLPMIGIGCGIATDHLVRSGVIGNGASPIWGMPASLATFDTAIVAGVFEEPMMMSAFCSVTKRRALVVAVVGSPASSSTVTFSGTPAISFGTNSSALRSGMPSAAAGPVVTMVMPMVISLVCACAIVPGSASAAASAAVDKNGLFIFPPCLCLLSADQTSIVNSTLPLGDGQQARRFAALAVHELLDDLLRHRRRLQLVGIIRV